MFRSIGVFSGALWLAGLGAVAGAEVQTPERAIENRYIVVLDDQQVGAAEVPGVARRFAREHGGRVQFVYRRALRGFALEVSARAAAAIARTPGVRYVEQDATMEIVTTQASATWGIDRIDQQDLPLGGSYEYMSTASGVHAYIIDTGIRQSHVEFGGRASTNGYTAVADGNGTNDCNGHGTHVAGTLGGVTYGVAKGVTLHSVRVLNCSGSGTTSGVIAGVDWVTSNAIKPAVANISLGGSASTALDDAVRNSVAAGVTYAVAAGNGNADACAFSPARVSQALTVGSSTNSDARSWFSNYGTCVDVFAPGSSITSAWYTGDTASNTIDGTSMASPHVAGAAALYLASNPQASPSTVHAAIVNGATMERLSAIGSGSPNRLLYSGFSRLTVDGSPVARFTLSCSGPACVFDASGSHDDYAITRYTWDFGDGQRGVGMIVGHTYGSAGTYTAVLIVTDNTGQSDIRTQSVSISGAGSDPCTLCQTYTGVLSGTGTSQHEPNAASYYGHVARMHRGWLRGPVNTDFNLHLQKWNGWWWVTVARSESATSEEQIAYAGTAGYYRWRVYSSSGSGAYTFWMQSP